MKQDRIYSEKGRELSNWADTFHCVPERVFYPKTEDEIIEVISFALKENKKVKVIGSLHSPSAIAMTNDYVISLDKYNKLSMNGSDEVVVEAGAKLHEIIEFLDKQGYALSVLGSISDQSISGAISTGTHGTGINFGPLSSLVVGLRLLTSSGQIIDVPPQDELFTAAICGIGALGIISKVTLKIEKAFNLSVSQFLMATEDVFNQWDKLIIFAEHVRFWYFPYCEHILVWCANRTYDEPYNNNFSWAKERFYGYHILEFLLFVFGNNSYSNYLNQFYFHYLFESRYPVVKEPVNIPSYIDKSFNVFNFDCLFKQYVTEWAVEASDGKSALAELKKEIETKNLTAHFPIEIRFVKKDESYIGMTSGRDSCFIGIIAYRPYGFEPERKEYWNIYERIMKKYNGRPHWAKDHGLTYETLAELYPNFNKFVQLRNKLDGKKLFSNDTLTRVLEMSKL